MANEEVLDELFNTGHERLIKIKLRNSGFKSIKEVKVYTKREKAKWFIFPITKEVTVTKFTVDEPLFVMETLADDLRIDDYKLKDSELEIEYT
jgi:hypothetical protein